MNKLFILIPMTLLINGCGGSGSGSKPDEIMQTAQLYTVKEGDKVVKTDVNLTTLIKVHHTDGSKESVVELIEGNATIIRK